MKVKDILLHDKWKNEPLWLIQMFSFVTADWGIFCSFFVEELSTENQLAQLGDHSLSQVTEAGLELWKRWEEIYLLIIKPVLHF